MAKSRFTIMMDYQRALSQAASLDKLAMDLVMCIRKNSENISQIQTYWGGENAHAYLRKMRASNEDLKRLRKNILNTSQTIKRIAKRTYDTEMKSLEISTRRTYH